MVGLSLLRSRSKGDEAGVAQTGLGSISSTKTWYMDRYQSMMIQRNLLAVVSLAALAGILVCAFAVQQIVRSKTIEPFVIEVEEKTGIATVVDQLSVKQYRANESLTRYFLYKYLQAREGYDINSYEHNYFRVVRLFSDGNVYKAFRRSVGQSNPDSPIIKLGAGFKREVKVKSIQFLDDTTAQLRFKLVDLTNTGGTKSEAHKIAIVKFSFVQLNMPIEDRYVNPLGFQVTGYTVDEEAVSADAGSKQ